MSITEPQMTLYHQLAETLAVAIHQGTLMPGSRLPAVRRCASMHQASITPLIAFLRIAD